MSYLMECVVGHWLMPDWLLQFEVVSHVDSSCMRRRFLTTDTRSFNASLSLNQFPKHADVLFHGMCLAPLADNGFLLSLSLSFMECSLYLFLSLSLSLSLSLFHKLDDSIIVCAHES